MECMWGALCDGCVGNSTVIFLTFPEDSMECHTISGKVCGAQLGSEPMSRAFHLSLSLNGWLYFRPEGKILGIEMGRADQPKGGGSSVEEFEHGEQLNHFVTIQCSNE
jgi:hypothetical protein